MEMIYIQTHERSAITGAASKSVGTLALISVRARNEKVRTTRAHTFTYRIEHVFSSSSSPFNTIFSLSKEPSSQPRDKDKRHIRKTRK